MAKHEPKVGDKLSLYTPCNNYWIAMVRRPYTIVSVNAKGTECVARECKLVFYGACYYDTIADEIRENPDGELVKLRWNEKRGRWQESPAGSYPRCADWSGWHHQPYLD